MEPKEEMQIIGEIMAMLQGVTLTGNQVPTFTKSMTWLSDQAKRIKFDIDHPPENKGEG